jgi:predicted ferric reductase
MRAARRRLSFETWWGLHLYAYLALALTLLHQLVVGTDFSDDPVARAYWLGLYGVAVGLILVFRLGEPLALSLRHRLRVANVVLEAPGVVSIYVTGRRLERLAVRAGQYFIVRFLAADGWWRAHPFSLSAAPNGAWLRLTIKELGDWTARLQELRPGTRLFVEGPYGAMTGARRTRPRVVLIAGGIGITPLRALLEELPAAPGQITLLYRASAADDLVFRSELDALGRLRGAAVHYLVGPRGRGTADPLSVPRLRLMVPDIAACDVFLCGPDGLMAAVRATLAALGVPAEHIHRERFG